MPKAPSPVLAAILAAACALGACHPQRKTGPLPPPPPPPPPQETPVVGARSQEPCPCATPSHQAAATATATATPTAAAIATAPARNEVRTTPAVYKTVWRRFVTPGSVRLVRTPARYRTVSERVLVAPAHTEWKRAPHSRPVSGAPGYGSTAVAPTGEVLCAVVVPARYVVRTRQVLVSPGGERRVQGPSVVQRVAERVMVSSARQSRVVHPAAKRIVHPRSAATSCTVPAPHRHPQHNPRPHARHLAPAPGSAPYGERG